MKKWMITCLLLIGLSIIPGSVSLSAEPQEVVFDEGENRTFFGYNTSMNFGYVAGEVAFQSPTVVLEPLGEQERCLLKLAVKSPVIDAVDVVVRVQVGDIVEERTADAKAQPVTGNEVTVDLSDFAGQTVSLEMAYVWEQSPQVTIWLVPPAAVMVYEVVPVSRETAELSSEAVSSEAAETSAAASEETVEASLANGNEAREDNREQTVWWVLAAGGVVCLDAVWAWKCRKVEK